MAGKKSGKQDQRLATIVLLTAILNLVKALILLVALNAAIVWLLWRRK